MSSLSCLEYIPIVKPVPFVSLQKVTPFIQKQHLGRSFKRLCNACVNGCGFIHTTVPAKALVTSCTESQWVLRPVQGRWVKLAQFLPIECSDWYWTHHYPLMSRCSVFYWCNITTSFLLILMGISCFWWFWSPCDCFYSWARYCVT